MACSLSLPFAVLASTRTLMNRLGIVVSIVLLAVATHAFDSEARHERAVGRASGNQLSDRDASVLPIDDSHRLQNVDATTASASRTFSTNDASVSGLPPLADASTLPGHLRDSYVLLSCFLTPQFRSNIALTTVFYIFTPGIPNRSPTGAYTSEPETSAHDFDSSRPRIERNSSISDVRSSHVAQASDKTTFGRRSTTQNGIYKFVLTIGMSNSSFASGLCSADSTGVSLLIIDPGSVTDYYLLPPCLKTWSTLNTLVASQLAINAWSDLNAGIAIFNCINCRAILDPAVAESVQSFDSSGYVLWPRVWQALPALQSFLLQSCYMMASIPSALSGTVSDFAMDFHSPPLGPIPATLLSNSAALPASNTFSLSFDTSGITGFIPTGLLSSLVGKTFHAFKITLSNNALTGSIPTDLFMPLQSAMLKNFNLAVSNNSLTGGFPTFPTGFWGSDSSSTFALADNRFTGPLPSDLFANLVSANIVVFDAPRNEITGSLPASFFGYWRSAGTFLRLDLSNNKISGTIPPSMLSSSLNVYSVRFLDFSVNLSHNELTGSIPGNLLYITSKRSASDLEVDNSAALDTDQISHRLNALNSLHSQREAHDSTATYAFSANYTTLDFSSNNLTSSIPNTLFSRMTSPTSLTLNVEANELSGPFPDLISAILAPPKLLLVAADGNQISGDAPTFCHSAVKVSYSLNNNQLNGTIPFTGLSNCSTLALSVSSNPNLKGFIPDALFSIHARVLRSKHESLRTRPFKFDIFVGSHRLVLDERRFLLGHFDGTASFPHCDQLQPQRDKCCLQLPSKLWILLTVLSAFMDTRDGSFRSHPHCACQHSSNPL